MLVLANIRQDDIVNIISPSLHNTISTDPIVLTFKDPLACLIHHPDIMLTMTSVANAMPCSRKPLLQALVKPYGPASKAMLYGTILHSLLQRALLNQAFSEGDTIKSLKEDLAQEERRLEVWASGLTLDSVEADLAERVGKSFERFENKWIGPAPKVRLLSLRRRPMFSNC